MPRVLTGTDVKYQPLSVWPSGLPAPLPASPLASLSASLGGVGVDLLVDSFVFRPPTALSFPPGRSMALPQFRPMQLPTREEEVPAASPAGSLSLSASAFSASASGSRSPCGDGSGSESLDEGDGEDEEDTSLRDEEEETGVGAVFRALATNDLDAEVSQVFAELLFGRQAGVCSPRRGDGGAYMYMPAPTRAPWRDVAAV